MNKKFRILLVEDDERLRHSIYFTLRRHGYSVEMAPDGLAGYEKICALRESEDIFSLVISDIQLPRLDGIQLIERISLLPIRIPVLIICGNCTKEMREKLSDLKVVAIINKPFDIEELIDSVKQVQEMLPSSP